MGFLRVVSLSCCVVVVSSVAAAAEAASVVSTTDGQVFQGSIVEDLPAGVMLRLGSGQTVFIERGRIRNVAKVAGEAATPAPEAAQAPRDAPVRTVSAPPPSAEQILQAPREVRTLSRAELNDELRVLDRARPSTGAAIALLITGAVLTPIGLGMDLVGLLYTTSVGNSLEGKYKGIVIASLLTVGTVFLVAGVTTLIIGAVKRARAAPYNARMRDVEDQLERLSDAEATPAR
jgi:hypothetical protein